MFKKKISNRKPKIKLARFYIDDLIAKNNVSKPKYTLAKSGSYFTRWKDQQDREDLAYKKRR